MSCPFISVKKGFKGTYNFNFRMAAPFRGSEISDLRYMGAPFIGKPPFAFRRRMGRVYMDSQAYIMYRMVDGGPGGEDDDLKLYRCENWFSADCNAFAYGYRGYMYNLGIHSHY
jgi:hypothetical protein